MAIHAKSNGWLIGGKIIEETPTSWIFQAMDEKRPKVIAKNDPKSQVFDGDSALDDAESWQQANRNSRRGYRKSKDIVTARG
ncbi:MULTISPECIES: hypothetical protein [unclassified Pantoea]|uniref:hypothetical protein n=1 Tax=unclassified Pantoea TaxID=2630326 RepID=UPI001CD40BD6|nr:MULTISPECIES: hypothetical protein [unclassified Pantoea]MCA1178906.1 hypothetical protein [Pantoea sp. alder69]MCA1253781.1 hypothetical protein [Pantoea sp. alder70]MCA1267395.1 hypothetical protein [Pantoea sp. alder81]